MREKIIKGIAALGLRQFVSLPLNAAGIGIASVFLSPADFGVYAIATVLINLALVIVDLGTTNALVQSRVTPSIRLLRHVQAYKLGAAVLCMAAYALISPLLTSYYHLPDRMALFWAGCALAAWLQSQRGFQSFRLQRRVEWELLARVEMIEIVAANVVLVAGAWLLRSSWAFLLSIGFRMALGGWLLGRFSRTIKEGDDSGKIGFRDLLGFGVPYQATTALSMIQKAMNPVLVGSLIGVSAVGFVNWSNYIVALPLLPLQPLYAFLFSVVSERQRQGEDDSGTIQVLLRAGLVVMSFASLAFILALPLLVSYIFGSKWTDAVPVASILLLGNTAAFHSSVLTTHLTANGHSGAWLRIVVAESALIWIIGGSATLAFGLVGYAAGILVAGLVVLAIQCPILRKLTGLDARFTDSLRLTVAVALACFAGRKAGSFVEDDGGLALGLTFAVAVLLFSGILFLADGGRIRRDFSKLMSMGKA